MLKTEKWLKQDEEGTNKKDIKKGLSSHGLPKRSPTLVLPVPEAA